MQDYRWLLFGAFPFGCLAILALTRAIKVRGWRYLSRLGGWVVVAAVLSGVDDSFRGNAKVAAVPANPSALTPVPQPKIPTAEEIARAYVKLQAQTLPSPPPGKVRKPESKGTISVTLKDGEQSVQIPSNPITWVDSPCIEADRLLLTQRQTTLSNQQHSAGLKYWRSITVLQVTNPLFRFRIRSKRACPTSRI